MVQRYLQDLLQDKNSYVRTRAFVLIGGLACDHLMEEQGLEFRPTKDVDMVLIVE